MIRGRRRCRGTMGSGTGRCVVKNVAGDGGHCDLREGEWNDGKRQGSRDFFGRVRFLEQQPSCTFMYAKAAAQGDVYAQNNLGICYNNGEVVDKGFAKAAAQG